MILHLDFETYSRADLRVVGVHRYAEDPSTGVWCAAFAFGEDEPDVWIPGFPLPAAVFTHIANGGEVWAHNAQFERLICNKVLYKKQGWPEISIEQTRCTMAMSHAMNLPGGLDRVASALGLPMRKDDEGRRIMLSLATPDKDGNFREPHVEPGKHARLREYCCQDVRVERAVAGRVLALSPIELKTYHLDQRINDRGIAVDVRAAEAALKLVESEEKRLNDRISEATGGEISTTNQAVKMVDWLQKRGVSIDSVAKDSVAEALDELDPDDVQSALPRKVLQIRREASRSSTKKLVALLRGVCKDGRLRGLVQYHGAGQTGRWAGRRFQAHNLTRATLDPATIDWILADPYRTFQAEVLALFGEPMSVVADCSRGFLKAGTGYRLISADLAQIEARVLPWLAGDEKKLGVFRRNEDLYCSTATDICRLLGLRNNPVTKTDKDVRVTRGGVEIVQDARQVYGKVPELALGYGGGGGAFISMGKNYGVRVTEAEAERIKVAWRNANPLAVKYWYRLEEAALNAVRAPGVGFDVKRSDGVGVTYKKVGSFLGCKLPSGRVIFYPYPKIIRKLTPWDEEKDCLTYQLTKEKTGEWLRGDTWGGKLCENVDQAVSRDVLRDALFRLEALQAWVALHVHDQAVCEVFEDLSKEINEAMAVVPDWAPGLPVGSDWWMGERFRK